MGRRSDPAASALHERLLLARQLLTHLQDSAETAPMALRLALRSGLLLQAQGLLVALARQALRGTGESVPEPVPDLASLLRRADRVVVPELVRLAQDCRQPDQPLAWLQIQVDQLQDAQVRLSRSVRPMDEDQPLRLQAAPSSAPLDEEDLLRLQATLEHIGHLLDEFSHYREEW